MLETIKHEIESVNDSEPFAEVYQKYIQDMQDEIIEQEVQHIANLMSSIDDRLAINEQIGIITKELTL